MAAAYAAIGNHGVIRTPYLVERVGSSRPQRAKAHRIVSEDREPADGDAAECRRRGHGHEAAIPGYTVAGKTGTAAKPENGRYVAKYVSSFVGLVPAEKPRFAILVAVDEPHGAIWGGVVAAPAFARIAQFVLQYLEVPPDAPETKTGATALR